MTGYVLPAPPIATVAVSGAAARFPVRRILCVGRNYAAHAREMGQDPEREPPFFFTKPADAVVDTGADIPYPSMTADLHHEIELVVAIAEGGADIAVDQALAHVFGYGVGVDLTRRDLQAEAKDKGRPWDFAKGFDRSAPMSPLVPASRIGHPGKAAIHLSVNGQVRQSADVSDMIWSVPEVIAEASRFIALAPGDLIFTGTPAGVGPLVRGDVVEGAVAGVGEVRFRIV